MGAERPFDRHAVDLARPGPALGTAQHDHRRPAPAVLRDPKVRVETGIHRRRHVPMHPVRLLPLDEMRLPAVAAEQGIDLLAGHSTENGGAGDAVAVQVQHRQHDPVPPGAQEPVRMPTGREGPGLGLPVADRAEHGQAGIVEGSTGRMGEGIAEFPALVDRPRRRRGGMGGDAPRKGELP